MAALFETIVSDFQPAGIGPSVTIPTPAGLTEGELLVAIGAVWGLTLAVITPPGGWSKDDEQGFPAFPTGFVASKVVTLADVIAGNVTFSQNLGGNEAWTIGLYRISGAKGFDSAKIQIVGGMSTTMAEPFIPLTAPNALGLKAVQASFATAGPTSITDSGSQTRRAIVNVPAQPGEPFAIYYTDDDSPLPFPPSTHSAHLPKGTYNGASGAKTSAHYGVSIFVFVPITTLDILERRRQLMSKGRHLTVMVANGRMTETDPAASGLYLVKDPDAGVGGFGKPPESASDARGDANDGWKLYSFDDVGTAYNL